MGHILSCAASTSRRLHFQVATLLLLGLLVTGGDIRAQRRAIKGPRALAVVEFFRSGATRIVPVTLLLDGRYYDAGIYKGTPVPMALEPGTVYEALRTGEPVGLFVVTAPSRVRRQWVAQGSWQPHNAARTEDSVGSVGEAPSPRRDDPDMPPVLRRGRPASAGSGQAEPAAPKLAGDGPPVLKRPSEESATVTPEQPSETTAPDSAPTTSTAPAPAPPPAASVPEDANRPRLRRNPDAAQAQIQGAGATTSSFPASDVSSSGANDKQTESAPSNVSDLKEALPAISDANGDRPRSYNFDWQPSEQERLTRAAEMLAASELAKYAGRRTRHEVGTLEEVAVSAFNLDFSNTPYIVVTASAPAKASSGDGEVRFYVAAIFRESVNQEVRPVLVQATDSSRLDAFPRLELVDAVDADGDQRAELLFRETTDLGRAYKLYRLIGDRATELFTSAPIRE